jgi:hypothetical protein
MKPRHALLALQSLEYLPDFSTELPHLKVFAFLRAALVFGVFGEFPPDFAILQSAISDVIAL